MSRNSLGRVINPATKQLLDMKAFLPDEVAIPPGSTFACEIDDQVLAWKAMTVEKKVVQATKTFSSLLHDSSWTGLLPDITKDDDNIQSFSYFPLEGGSRFLEIRDPQGKLLGFRFPITDENIAILTASQTILSDTSGTSAPSTAPASPGISPSPTSQPGPVLENTTSTASPPGLVPASGNSPALHGHKRGTYSVKHWGVWGDYNKDFFMTKEMRTELDIANQWLKKNQGLFHEVSNVLRMVDASQYVHCRNNLEEEMGKVAGPDGQPLKPVAGVWHAVAININQVGSSSEKHQDWKDNKTSYNCVVPWGSWGGGDFVLWPLRMRIEVKEGFGFLFPGAIIAHSVTPIQKGRRYSLILLLTQLMEWIRSP